jgi:glutathione reductase (NADPH)
VEFAGIFNGLGVDTTIIYRGREILSRFDMDLRRLLHAEYENKGIRVVTQQIIERVERAGDGRLTARLSGGELLRTDAVMLAVGRVPNTQGMGLEEAGIQLDARGAVCVDEYSRTSLDHVWAIGDVTDRMQLTPIAIHEAMCFVETVFHGRPTKPDYRTVATAIFSQPEIGTVGLPEDEARRRFVNLDIYKAAFRPMRNILAGRSERMLVKLVVDADTDRVVGAHALGPDAGEMAQLLAVPIKMGARKADFDATIAVHPTAAEEFVTMRAPTERIRGREALPA